MKISLKKINQIGVLSLHAVIPLVLVVTAVGGVGAYVITKSKAYGSNVCYISSSTVTVNGMTGDYYHVMVQNRTDAALQLANMKFQAKGTNGTATIGYYDANGKPTANLLKWASGFSGTQLDKYGTSTGFVRKPVNPNNVGAANYKFAGDGKTFDASCQVIPAGTSFDSRYSSLVSSGENKQYAISCEIIGPEKVVGGQPANFTVRIKNAGTVNYGGYTLSSWSVASKSGQTIYAMSSADSYSDYATFPEIKVGDTKDITINSVVSPKFSGTEPLIYSYNILAMSTKDVGAVAYSSCSKNWTLN